MLRRDVEETVVGAAARTPFEAPWRVFVLERADTMNDEAANSLLKTLEEPPSYVVPAAAHRPPEPGAADHRQPLPGRALRPARPPRPSPSGSSPAAWRPRRRWPARGCRSATGRRRWRSGSRRARRCAPTPRRSPARRSPAASRSTPWEPLLKTAQERGRVAREVPLASARRARRPRTASPRRRGARRRAGARPRARARLPAARPGGTGKRAAARAFAAELLSRGARDPANARARVEHGSHPDLTWVAPSGAHEMLRRDVDEAVVAAAAAHAVRGALARVRARARGHDERRDGQLAAQDARGAAALRRAAAAHRPPEPGAADDRLPLPGRALRRARRRGRRAAAAVARRGARGGAGLRPALARRRREGAGARARRGPRAARRTRRRSPARRSPAAPPRAPWEPLLKTARERGRVARERSSPRSPRSSPTCPRRSTSAASGSSASRRSAPSAAPPPARWTRRCS